MSEHVLITGATGFIGKRLAASLHGDGRSVRALARDAERAKASVRELDDAFAWSALDDARGEVLRDVRAVVHLAGESVAGLWTADRRRRIEESRVKTTRALVDAIAKADPRPRVLVSASAVGYYGDPADHDREITEEHAPGEGFLARVCVQWEREAERAEQAGVRVVRLRIGLVLGPEGGTLGAMLPAYKAGLGGKLGSGRQLWPWIHVDDLVALFRRAIEDETFSGAYNAVSPHPMRQVDIAKTLASILHRPAFLPAPAFALKGVLGDFANEMLVSRRVVPRRALDAGFVFQHPDLEPALRDLLGHAAA